MLFSSIASSFLVTLPLASAEGQLGLSLGVKHVDGTCKYTADYENDFDTLAEFTKTVRVYAASDCNTLQQIAPALESKGFSLYLGVWPDDDAHFAAEKQALQTYFPTISKSTILGITVGSEALYRKDMTAEVLAGKISDVRSFIATLKDKNGESYASVPVGTADSWNVLVDGGSTSAIEASDFVFANAFAYWQGQTMNNASYSFADDIMQALGRIESIKKTNDITFWVGETGWPTGGENFGAAHPSVENAAQFFKEGVCALRAWGINTFMFEAFDEPWKEKGVEQDFGIFDVNGKPKYDLSC